MVLFYQIRIAPTHVLHYLRRTYYVDQFVVHQIFLTELLPHPQNVYCLANLQNVVRLWVHHVGNVGQVTIEHRSYKSCNHKNNGGVQGRKTITANNILILITVYIKIQPVRRILFGQAPIDTISIRDVGSIRRTYKVDGGILKIGLEVIRPSCVHNRPRLIDIVNCVQSNQRNIKSWKGCWTIASRQGLIQRHESIHTEISRKRIDKHTVARNSRYDFSVQLISHTQREVVRRRVVYRRVQHLSHVVVVRHRNSPITVTHVLESYTLELLRYVARSHLLQQRHLVKPSSVKRLISVRQRRSRKMRSRIQRKGVTADNLQRDYHGATGHQIGLSNRIKSGKQNHGSEYNEQNNNKPNPARYLIVPLNGVTQNSIGSRIVKLNFRVKSAYVYTELPEPVVERQTRVRERPVHYDLDFVQERNSRIERNRVVVRIPPASHQRIHTLELLVTVFDLQGRQVKVDKVKERKGQQSGTGRIERTLQSQRGVVGSQVEYEPRKQEKYYHRPHVFNYQLPRPGHNQNRQFTLHHNTDHMHQYRNHHVTAELEILSRLVQRVTVHVSHQRVEEDQVDRQEYLYCRHRRVQVHPDLTVGKHIRKGRFAGQQFLQIVLDLINTNVVRIHVLQELLLSMTVLPKVEFGLFRLVHENAEESLLQILDVELTSVSVAVVADDLLTDKDHHEEEVEIGQVEVGYLRSDIDVEEEFDNGNVSGTVGSVRLQYLTDDDEYEDVEHDQIHVLAVRYDIIAEHEDQQRKGQHTRVDQIVDLDQQHNQHFDIAQQERDYHTGFLNGMLGIDLQFRRGLQLDFQMLILFSLSQLIPQIGQGLIHRLFLIPIDQVPNQIANDLIIIGKHLFNDVIVLKDEVPHVKFDILMENNPIDVLDNVLQSIVVLVHQGNVGVLHYEVLQEHGEQTMVVGDLLCLNLQLDAFYMLTLLKVLEVIVERLHLLVHGRVPLFDDAHGLPNTGVKTEDLLVLMNEAAYQVVVVLEGQAPQKDSLPLLQLLPVVLRNSLETLGGVEVQPQLNEEHQQNLLNAGQRSKFVNNKNQSTITAVLCEGHPENDGDEYNNELQNIENAEIDPSVMEDSILLAEFSEDTNVDVEEGDGQQHDGQITVHAREQHEHQQRDDEVRVHNHVLVEESSNPMPEMLVSVVVYYYRVGITDLLQFLQHALVFEVYLHNESHHVGRYHLEHSKTQLSQEYDDGIDEERSQETCSRTLFVTHRNELHPLLRDKLFKQTEALCCGQGQRRSLISNIEQQNQILQQDYGNSRLIDVLNQTKTQLPKPKEQHSEQIGKPKHVTLRINVQQHQPQIQSNHKTDAPIQQIHGNTHKPKLKVNQHISLLIVSLYLLFFRGNLKMQRRLLSKGQSANHIHSHNEILTHILVDQMNRILHNIQLPNSLMGRTLLHLILILPHHSIEPQHQFFHDINDKHDVVEVDEPAKRLLVGHIDPDHKQNPLYQVVVLLIDVTSVKVRSNELRSVGQHQTSRTQHRRQRPDTRLPLVLQQLHVPTHVLDIVLLQLQILLIPHKIDKISPVLQQTLLSSKVIQQPLHPVVKVLPCEQGAYLLEQEKVENQIGNQKQQHRNRQPEIETLNNHKDSNYIREQDQQYLTENTHPLVFCNQVLVVVRLGLPDHTVLIVGRKLLILELGVNDRFLLMNLRSDETALQRLQQVRPHLLLHHTSPLDVLYRRLQYIGQSIAEHAEVINNHVEYEITGVRTGIERKPNEQTDPPNIIHPRRPNHVTKHSVVFIRQQQNEVVHEKESQIECQYNAQQFLVERCQQAETCEDYNSQAEKTPLVTAPDDDNPRYIVQTLQIQLVDQHDKANKLGFSPLLESSGLGSHIAGETGHDRETVVDINVRSVYHNLYLRQHEDDKQRRSVGLANRRKRKVETPVIGLVYAHRLQPIINRIVHEEQEIDVLNNDAHQRVVHDDRPVFFREGRQGQTLPTLLHLLHYYQVVTVGKEHQEQRHEDDVHNSRLRKTQEEHTDQRQQVGITKEKGNEQLPSLSASLYYLLTHAVINQLQLRIRTDKENYVVYVYVEDYYVQPDGLRRLETKNLRPIYSRRRRKRDIVEVSDHIVADLHRQHHKGSDHEHQLQILERGDQRQPNESHETVYVVVPLNHNYRYDLHHTQRKLCGIEEVENRVYQAYG